MFTRRRFITQGTAALAGATLLPTWLSAQKVQLAGSTPSGAAMRPIPTATGEIRPDEMGITSLHEHIPFRLEDSPGNREQSRAFAIEELTRARKLGLRTIIDVGPADDIRGKREVALASGVNVVCCTGFYVLREQQQSMKLEEFEEHMLREIESGIQGSSIRPGVIKVASKNSTLTPAERAVFTAAARVQQRYKLPICTHAVSGCVEQARVLEEAGADLNHCYFSHTEAVFGWNGRPVDQEIAYLEQVIAKGGTLSFNNFGNWAHTPEKDLAHIIQTLIERGHDGRMVATMDTTWGYKDNTRSILWEQINAGGKDRTYAYLLEKVVPWLRANGISQASVDKFILHNPRRIFSIPAA